MPWPRGAPEAGEHEADAMEIRVVKGRRSVVLTRAEAVALIGELAECVACVARFGTAVVEIGE